MTDPTGHSRYAEWDGAYVLGALAPADRRTFEAHLETCPRCRAAVAELSGLPGLLGRLDEERAFALLDDEAADMPPTPPADLVARIERAQRRRRTRRLRVIVGVAAAVAAIAAVAVPVSIAAMPHPQLTVALRQAQASPLSADVALTRVTWGTRIDMRCRYGTENAWQ
ncbi:MAG TPA: zf-HC2 domain-containing protein, partial [Pseudolysinimonas sp.]|nr:zf-HC2 domain-containing protein [Pseudolysinimonas sp.]